MKNERSDEVVPLVDVCLRRSRAHDVLAAVSKFGLVVLSLIGGLVGFLLADEHKVSVVVGLLVGMLPPLLVAAFIVGWYQLVAIPRFRRTLGQQSGESLEQYLNAPLLNLHASAAAADDCLFAKCMVDIGHTGLALRVARAQHNLSESIRSIPAEPSTVRIDESDGDFAALAHSAGYTFDTKRKTRTRNIILALALLFLIVWIAIFSWGEDVEVVLIGIIGALATAAFALLKHRIRFSAKSTEAWMTEGMIIVQKPRALPQTFVVHNSLLIWWVDRGRITLANENGQECLRVTHMEGRLACRTWCGRFVPGETSTSSSHDQHAIQPQP